MKKIINIIFSILFVLLIANGCSCNKDKKDSKVALGVGDMNATTYETISMAELKTKITDKDSFVLYVFSPTCGGCAMFKPIIESVISSEDLIIYAIEYNNIEKGHELKSLQYTPSIVVYNKGELFISTDPDKNEEYFKNDEGFKTFLNKYTYKPTMYYISKEQLKSKIDNDENFIIYYSRNDCGDCAYMYKNYLKEFLYKNPNTKKFYVIETNAEGVRLNNGSVDAVQWQAFKDEFGLSAAGNSTFGYGVGYVPTIQYYNDGAIADMFIYFNDDMSYVRNSDGSTTVTINGSYYSDNPYIGDSMLYNEYKDTLAPFYNGKLTAFINNNLGLVD